MPAVCVAANAASSSKTTVGHFPPFAAGTVRITSPCDGSATVPSAASANPVEPSGSHTSAYRSPSNTVVPSAYVSGPADENVSTRSLTAANVETDAISAVIARIFFMSLPVPS